MGFPRMSSRFAMLVVGLLATGCPAKVATVDVTPKELTIKSDTEVKAMTAAAKDKNGKDIDLGERKPTWTSADPAVAVVDVDGKVKPTGSGKTTITAKID